MKLRAPMWRFLSEPSHDELPAASPLLVEVDSIGPSISKPHPRRADPTTSGAIDPPATYRALAPRSTSSRNWLSAGHDSRSPKVEIAYFCDGLTVSRDGI